METKGEWMMVSAGVVLYQLEVFAVLICVGIFGIKTHIIDEKYLGSLSTLIMRLILPIMIFTKVVNSATREDMISRGPDVFISALITYAFLFSAGYILIRVFSLKGNNGRVFWAATVFGNVGFIGIPLMLGVLPDRGMLYMAVFSPIDQCLMWTIGFYLTLPKEKTEHRSLTENLRNILNPAMLAIALSLLFVFLGWKPPRAVNQALQAVADSTTPLSLIYIGASFCLYDVRRFVTRFENYAIVIVKMVAVPVCLYYLLTFIHVQSEVAVFITLMAGMPSMAAVAMFARVNGSDEECALGAILVTTIACLFTLPLVAFLTSF